MFCQVHIKRFMDRQSFLIEACLYNDLPLISKLLCVCHSLKKRFSLNRENVRRYNTGRMSNTFKYF